MFKIERKQLEDIRKDGRSKLRLSPIFTAQQEVSKVDETEETGRMTLRKRACPAAGGKQPEGTKLARGIDTSLLMTPTSFAQNEEPKSIHHDNNMTKIRAKTLGEDDRIFTIATTAAVCVALLTLLGLVCLFGGNKALLVSAHNSTPLPASSGPQQTTGRSLVVPISRQHQQPAQQQTMKMAESSPTGNVAKERHERSQKTPAAASIDRFDSGEQIRPPLLRQPTTLAPLTSGSLGDRRQANGHEFNMQPAASSQESFMSPEERDQLLKQQESHYEGKSSQDSSSEPGDGQQHWRPQQQAAEGKQGGGNQLQSEASNAAGSNDADDGDYEDDGSEPAHNSNKPGKANANLVPDNRRQSSLSSPPTGGAVDGGFRRSSRPASRPMAAAAANSVDSNDESGDSSNDYDGANDDAYFSRKANGRGDSNGVDGGGSPPARLNQAATHNNQHQRSSSGYGSQGNNRRSGPRGSAYGGGDDVRGNRGHQETPGGNGGGESSTASNEPEGFGPGPNEAYMADKAESGGKDPDDDGAYGPGGEGEPGAGPQVDDDVKFDRRNMDEHNHERGSPGAVKSNSNANAKISGNGYVKPINYESENSPFGDQNNGGGGPGEESEADEGPDSSGDESGPAFAPSSQAEIMSRPSSNVATRKPNELQQANLVPVTADSRPVAASTGNQPPQPATGSLGNQHQLVFNRQHSSQPFGISTSNQLPQTPTSRNIPAPAMQPVVITTTSNPINSLMNQHQQQQLKPSSHAPYNPQNNPSHVGKYFIN